MYNHFNGSFHSHNCCLKKRKNNHLIPFNLYTKCQLNQIISAHFDFVLLAELIEYQIQIEKYPAYFFPWLPIKTFVVCSCVELCSREALLVVPCHKGKCSLSLRSELSRQKNTRGQTLGQLCYKHTLSPALNGLFKQLFNSGSCSFLSSFTLMTNRKITKVHNHSSGYT